MCEIVQHKSSQSGMTFLWWKNMLNHQIEMFCNKSRPCRHDWLWCGSSQAGMTHIDPHSICHPCKTLCGPLLQCISNMCIWSWSKFGWTLFFHGNTCSSQSRMNPCVQWCPTSHPSLGWLFCEKWWKNALNHQIVLFCNKYRPWLAMVWVIPGWDDPR